MIAREVFVSLVFILAIISLISVLFTDRKKEFGTLSLALIILSVAMSRLGDFDIGFGLLTLVMGISLITLEGFIPSFGLIGISGIILTIFSIKNYFLYREGGAYILSAVAAAIILTATIYVRLGFRAELFDKAILNKPRPDQDPDKDKKDLVGMKGISLTILRPVGKIELGGEVHEATSQTSFIAKDRPVEVVAIKNGKIIVKEQA